MWTSLGLPERWPGHELAGYFEEARAFTIYVRARASCPGVHAEQTRLATPPRQITTELISDADDLNPPIITSSTAAKGRTEIVVADGIWEQVAAEDHLRWDASKERSVTFSPHRPILSAVTLGNSINSRLNFQPHIDSRARKAVQFSGAMARLGNSNGGMSPEALRALYTGSIRPIFTWGAELWNRDCRQYSLSGMHQIDYKALRKITGAYHGSSHQDRSSRTLIEQTQHLHHMGSTRPEDRRPTDPPISRRESGRTDDGMKAQIRQATRPTAP